MRVLFPLGIKPPRAIFVLLLALALVGCDGALHTNNLALDCSEGENRTDTDTCQECACQNGQWICNLGGCGPAECDEGDQKVADDGCNECICQDQSWYCSTNECAPSCEAGAVESRECETCTCESGQWICENICIAETCEDGDAREDPDACTSCVCSGGEWQCEDVPCGSDRMCTDGEVRPAYDRCNRCVCVNNQWACTVEDCQPDTCEEGDERPALDGCNQCVCTDGTWQCSEEMCEQTQCQDGTQSVAEDGCNLCVCRSGEWHCTERQCDRTICEEGDFYAMNDGCTQCECVDNRWTCEAICVAETNRCTPGDEFQNQNGQRCRCDVSGQLVCRCTEDPPVAGCQCTENGEWRCPQQSISMCARDRECTLEKCIAALCENTPVDQCLQPEESACLRSATNNICVCAAETCVFDDANVLNQCLSN